MENSILTLIITNGAYGKFTGFKVTFSGFTKIPFRFSEYGWPGGKYLLKRLHDKFPNFTLTISRQERSNVVSNGDISEVTINFDDLQKFFTEFWHERGVSGNKAIEKGLGSIFPHIFEDSEYVTGLLPEEIMALIPSREKLKKVVQFLHSETTASIPPEDTIQFQSGADVFRSIHLEGIIKEYEAKLGANLPESSWQKFLENNMLVLNPGYIKAIPKINIQAVKGQIPDFLLISIEGYVDVYEIKLPKTELLTHDQGHDNYYWSTEISMAIAQVENYIYTLTSEKDTLERLISETFKLPLTILRPRGHVIAGLSSQLIDKKRKDGFWLLNESLRNTRIIPFDSLLNTFKNLKKSLLDKEISP